MTLESPYVPTQVLLIEKQPVRILRPLPKVEVAVADILMVSLPVLPMERRVPGVEVPIPTFPLPFTPLTMNEGVELPLLPTHREAVSVPCSTERTPNGEVVPTPRLPDEFHIPDPGK